MGLYLHHPHDLMILRELFTVINALMDYVQHDYVHKEIYDLRSSIHSTLLKMRYEMGGTCSKHGTTDISSLNYTRRTRREDDSTRQGADVQLIFKTERRQIWCDCG
jgi:hypothetical protein